MRSLLSVFGFARIKGYDWALFCMLWWVVVAFGATLFVYAEFGISGVSGIGNG